MKKNKIFAIIAILAITISGVLVFQACKKGETNTTNNQTTENPVKSPLLTYNKKTMQTVVNIDITEFQTKINEYYDTKDDNGYIVSSIEIDTDFNDNSKGEDNSAVKITLIDTEQEKSETEWLGGGFWERVENGDNIDYYIADDILDGNYSFFIADKEYGYNVCMRNGVVATMDTIQLDTIQTPMYGPYYPWCISCTTKDGCRVCGKHVKQFVYYCDCDWVTYPYPGDLCSTTTVGGSTMILGALSILVMIALAA